jgi:uncharacterized protein
MDVDTPSGTAWVDLDRPRGAATALLVLAHGASGGIESRDLVAVRDAAAAAGIAVARVTQPYRVLGRRAPAPAPRLDEAWLAVIAALRRRRGLTGLPLVCGGRSNGARVVCRTAPDTGAAGVITLAFPLHPPGRPDKSRLAELEVPTVPVLVVQGDRDSFGLPPSAPGRQVVIVPGADHALRRDLASVASTVVAFVTTVAARATVGQ